MGLIETIMPGYAAKRKQAQYELAYYQKVYDMLETIPSFAQDTDEGEWSLTGSANKMPASYTEYDFDSMRDSARSMYLKDPSARNIIDTIVNYVIGKDCSFEAIDENEQVQEYWDEWSRVNKWDLRAKEAFRRLLRDGEFFLRRFNPKTGGQFQLVRFIDPAEIKDPNGFNSWGIHSLGIECDPDDVETPLFYYRNYTDIDNSIKWERIPAGEIIHCKIMTDSDCKRGLSFLIGVAEYMTKHKSWLNDRIILNKVRHLFHVVGEPTGPTATDTVKAMFNDTTGKTPSGGTANKKLPKTGSMLIAKGIKWKYENLNINAADTADDGRAIELMVAKGTQLPEYIVRGDASNANYASTSVQESPFVKAMEAWQDIIEKPFKQVFRETIEYGIITGIIPKTSTRTTIEYINGVDKTTVEKIETITECNINYPTLVHRDIEAETRALAIQDNQKYVSKETASVRLGYDYKEEKSKIEKQDIESEERMKKMTGFGEPNPIDNKDKDDEENKE